MPRPTDRSAEAIDLVAKNRRGAGRWRSHPLADVLDFDMAERADEPSRWSTLRALRVLDGAGRGG